MDTSQELVRVEEETKENSNDPHNMSNLFWSQINYWSSFFSRAINKSDEPSKLFLNYPLLADEMKKELSGYLNLKEISSLAITSKPNNTLFSNTLMTAKNTKLLMLVAHGEEPQAHALIGHQSKVLLERGDVTDYSGRTFKNITAYEYAYWAKDWHMCRMLESHMDEETKAVTLSNCEKMERDGLTYTQHGVPFPGSKHFDFTPLKNAYNNYLQVYNRWVANTATLAELNDAWRAIGVEQLDVPAFVAQEYCRPDRSFYPKPVFNEPNLPRLLTFYNYSTSRVGRWFPSVVSDTDGLGVSFVLSRGGAERGEPGELVVAMWGLTRARIDLEAVTGLDEVSNIELTRSRENLQPLAYDLERPGYF